MIPYSDAQKTVGVWLSGAVACVAMGLAFAILSPSCAHWFVAPVALCALVLVPDVADWLSGKIDLYDPSGLVAILGLHFFFLAPLLHVHWGYWMGYIAAPADWRPWLGYMGLLNFLGLILYKAVNRGPPISFPPLRTAWILDERRFFFFCGAALLVALLAQIYVYAQFGGIWGYMMAYEAREGAFGGKGWLFIISESFPILAFMFYAVASRNRPRLGHWASITLVLLAFVAVKMVFGGLRGSRSNTIFGLFWAAGIIHYWIRPLNRKLVFAGVILLTGFMYVYGFYKIYGLDALPMMRGSGSYVERTEEVSRSIDKTLLGDMGRSDIQAFLLYRLTERTSDYSLRWGQTYLHWLTLMLPESLRFKLDGKREAGTEAQYGDYSEDFLSSRVYGLAGEAMLNFGVLAVPFAFGLFGWLVAKTRWFIHVLPRDDVRIMLAPFLVSLMVIVPSSDANNCEFFIVKNGIIPFALLWLSVRRYPLIIEAAHGFPREERLDMDCRRPPT